MIGNYERLKPKKKKRRYTLYTRTCKQCQQNYKTRCKRSTKCHACREETNKKPENREIVPITNYNYIMDKE